MISLTKGQTIRLLSTMAQPSIHHAIKVDFFLAIFELIAPP